MNYSLRNTFTDTRGRVPALNGKRFFLIRRDPEVRYMFEVEIYIPAAGVLVTRLACHDEVFEAIPQECVA